MALKEVFHVVSMNLPIDSSNFSTEDSIPAGRLVTLNALNQVILPPAQTSRIVGVTGDNKVQTFSSATTPDRHNVESSGIVVGANGGSVVWTQNRASDNYNETLASGKITVYSGGEFYTDQYALENDAGTVADYTNADPLYATSDAGGNADNESGLFTPDSTGSKEVVAIVLSGPSPLASGVPGVDLQGAMTFGNYLHFVMRV